MPSKPPIIAQERADTCAIACLRMLLAYHGRMITEQELVQAATMEHGGMDIEELERLAIRFALRADIRKLGLLEIAALLARRIFPIVYLNRVHLDRRFPLSRRIALRLFLPHAVLPVRVSRHFVIFHDPLSLKPRRVSRHKFETAQSDLGNWCVVCSQP
jgi:ABC-type bacteriocin/lantibiotic exporter with double-glycine peptidase domain